MSFKPNGQANQEYDVLFGGPNSGTGTEHTEMPKVTRTNLLPRSNYTISVRAMDANANLLGLDSVPVICQTSAGVPSSPYNVSATLNSTSIYIVWFPPNTDVGVIDGWHVAVGNARDSVRDSGRVTCDNLYNDDIKGQNSVKDIPNVRTFNYIANLPNVLRYEEVLFCVRSYNTEYESSWASGSRTVRDLVRGGLSPFSSSNGSLSSTVTALVILAVLAIIAAIVIAVVLAIALFLRQKKLSPTEVYDDTVNKQNTSVASNQSKVAVGFMKRNRTPQRLASNASTRPIVELDNEYNFGTIKGTESDNSSQSMEEKCTEP